AHRALRLDLGPAAGAGHHLAARARWTAGLGGQRRDQRPDGLPLPARRGTPARRRAARRLRGALPAAPRQRRPGEGAAGPAGPAPRRVRAGRDLGLTQPAGSGAAEASAGRVAWSARTRVSASYGPTCRTPLTKNVGVPRAPLASALRTSRRTLA